MTDAVKEAEEVRAKAIALMQRYDDEMGDMRRKGARPSAEHCKAAGDALCAVRIADRNLCRAREDVVKRAVFKRPAMVHRVKAGKR